MPISRKYLRWLRHTAALMLLALFPAVTGAQPIVPSDQQWDTWLKVCAGGKTDRVLVSIDLAFRRWREGVVKGVMSAGSGSLGAIIEKIPVDASDSGLFREYQACLDRRVKEWERAANPKLSADERFRHLLTAKPVYIWTSYGERADRELDPRPAFNQDGRVVSRGGLSDCRLPMDSAKLNLRIPQSDVLMPAASACKSSEAFQSEIGLFEKDWATQTVASSYILLHWSARLANNFRSCLSKRSLVPIEYLQGVETSWRVSTSERTVGSAYCLADSPQAISDIVRDCDARYRSGGCANCSEIAATHYEWAREYLLGKRFRTKTAPSTIAIELSDALNAQGIRTSKAFRDCVLLPFIVYQ